MQEILISCVADANLNAVLVITSSYPYAITHELPAIIHTAHGSPESGNAMSDVLLGKYNPAGRTPQTWYKSECDLPDIKNYDIASSGATYMYFEGEPLFPFGHGLSYSKFEYSCLSVKNCGEEIRVSFKVQNTSDIDGVEVVQVYFAVENPRVKRPLKQLCAFERRATAAGETADFSLTIDKQKLRFWDVTRGKFAVESGEYRFSVGASSGDIRLTAEKQINGETIPLRVMSAPVPAVDYDNKRSIALRYDKRLGRHYVHAPAWNGAIEFFDVDLAGISGIEITAATALGEGKVGVFVDDTKVGEVAVAACVSPTQWGQFGCDFAEPRLFAETGKLTLKLSEHTNLLEVRVR
jgi:beta-glucosidase